MPKEPSVVMQETLTNPPEDRDAMVDIQRKVADEAIFEDEVDTDRIEVVAGVDQAFTEGGDIAVSATVTVRDGETIETATARRKTQIPYIPGLLAFREGEAVVASVRALETKPDVVLVDGSGRIHPRQAGLATHVGVAFGIPTVGVAKSLLCGEPSRHIERLEEGDRVEIVADDDVDAPNGTVIGYAVQTKQYAPESSTTVNPLYVSPGHLLGAKTATSIVKKECDSHKLPEPVRRADALAEESK
jgi:deoxyribonuclease V